ncbi:MAG: prepilin-type N-terminal cleavage/methylation domain-containing protein [Candidatus Methylomirabilia bacterium]
MTALLHPSGNERGFTLVEVLIAIGLLTVGVVGIVGLVGVQSGGAARGVSFGQAAITRSNALSSATMLAQARLEQIKNARYTAAQDDITSANFPDEAYGDIAGYPNHRRTVTIQDGVPAAGMKTLTVDVFFRPLQETGIGQEEQVRLITMIAQRP